MGIGMPISQASAPFMRGPPVRVYKGNALARGLVPCVLC